MANEFYVVFFDDFDAEIALARRIKGVSDIFQAREQALRDFNLRCGDAVVETGEETQWGEWLDYTARRHHFPIMETVRRCYYYVYLKSDSGHDPGWYWKDPADKQLTKI